MKDIISVDYELFLDNIDLKGFDSKSSLSDADIVIFDPKIHELYYKHSTYSGKKSFDLDTSTKMKESAKHWNRELNSFLEAGKNVFIFLRGKEEFYLDSGQRETSGTGRNQKVTHIVDLYDNYKFFPLRLQVHNAEGKKVISKNNLIKTFLDDFKDVFSYKAYIEEKGDNIQSLLLNKTQDKIVSGVLKYKNGNIIFLPYIAPFYEHFFDDEDDFTDEGNIYQRKIIKNILEIDKTLSGIVEKSPKPNWIEEEQFRLKNVQEIEKKIKINLDEIKRIEEKNHDLEIQRSNEEVLLDLLYETGKPLESAVIKALQILGYKAENFDDGVLELDQVIISPEGDRYIGECEGKDNKSIDITKFRQLQDSLNEDFQREEVEEKAFGILFGNPYRNTEIVNRTEFFTTKCIKGAEREKIGLIKTIELFFVCKYLVENKDERFKKNCRKKIHESLGKVIELPEIPSK
ncbi:hypothetical protein HZQ19_02390 [Elizabethkingia anophelis]|uniref:hypothetical protein n=1 Tax=Elizabethkingia anophelis TaxID=1117645 RepID=UPI000C9A0FD8|nr:hypothetical protein [Elizabethkingia anophelis]MCT3758535.1 hypothetical protein [Elizabethkingia anophelis]MCT3971817.1 hypothetical protein [Elizabethkingia anophelis]MCT4000282.1 hypothetical protein [Elizabethkingia anophelis]MCT4014737.1 hypothetical protein [Elizabethkingia anophelis]MCT4018298.1 hypothetical protein [Elizabethkingia anophelis]